MDQITTTTISLLIGVLPVLIWLFYWLQEDRKNPEPIYRIYNAFILGALTIPFVMYFQQLIEKTLLNGQPIENFFSSNYTLAIVVIFIWAGIEEFFKFLAAYFGGISKKDNDEPIDSLIYLITAALGFAAFENILYVLGPLTDSVLITQATQSALITGNTRFIGATLLHVASSATLGMFIAFSYYKSKAIKFKFLMYGFVVAISLHTVFNYFIIKGSILGDSELIRTSFMIVWSVIILIILLFEKIKKIYKPLK